MNNKIIGITMGDPAGVGPEIIIKAFLDESIALNKIIVLGNEKILYERLLSLGYQDKLFIKTISSINDYIYKKHEISVIDPYPELTGIVLGKVQYASGMASYKYIELAVSLAMDKKISSIVTGPINKEALALTKLNYPGHTEILASLSKTKSYAMLLFTEKLKVIHATTHISMRKMIDTLSKERIKEVSYMANNFVHLLQKETPKIAVAALNPHAGENSLFGDEEKNIIIPALNELRSEGIPVIGPVAPDTVFLRAYHGEFDIVIALYHDQGHIPIKMLGLENGVNITVGLPFMRTSVDHGTAFNIVDKYIANPSSMILSIELAIKLQGLI